MNLYKKLAGQTLVYGLGTMVPRFLNYAILTVWYTRLFKVSEYGVITELYAYVVFLLVILTYGMETGLFRFATKDGDKNLSFSTAVVSLFITSGTFILLVFVFSRNIAHLLEYDAHPEYIRWLALIVGIDAFSAIPFAWLRVKEKSRKFTFIKIANVVFTIIFVVLFFVVFPWLSKFNKLPGFLYNKDIRVGYVLIANVWASSLTLLLLIGEIFSVKINFSKSLWKKMLLYSYPLLIAGLAGTINETMDRILLKYMLPANYKPLYEIGIYGANYKIAIVMMLFVQMFRYAAEPFYFNYAKEKSAQEIYSNILRYFYIIGLFIFLLVTLYIDFFKYFIAEKFFSGLSIVPIVLFSYLLYGLFFNLSIWYKLTDKTKYGAILTFIGALITLIINIIFIPRFSYVASAYAHLVCYAAMVIISWVLGRRYYKIDYKVKRLMEYLFVTLVLYFISHYLHQANVLINTLLNTVLIASFVMYIIKREKFRLNQLIKLVYER